MIISTNAVHEPTDYCRETHCAWHNVDEPGPGYIACPECFHLYRTARALRRTYRRRGLRLYWNDLRHPVALPADDAEFWGDLRLVPVSVPIKLPPIPRFPRLSTLRAILRLPFVRASRISFCPSCLHDF